MASIEDSCDSINKFIKAQLDFFVVQLISMQKACESIISSIERRLEEFKQERQNAHFTTLQVNTFNLEAEFRNVLKEYQKSTMNALRIEILEEIRSLRKDLLAVNSSGSVRDGTTYAMNRESEDWEDEPQRKRPKSRNYLIFDSVKQLDKNYMRACIANDRVELRCESAAHERIVIRTPASTLLTQPAHTRGHTPTGALGALFAERIDNVGRPPAVDRPVEEVLFQIPVQNQVEEMIQAETSVDKTMQVPTIQDITIQDLIIQEQGVHDQEMEEISNGVNISPQIGRISSTLDRSAEIPDKVLSPNEVVQQSNIEHLTSALQEAGRADFQPPPASAGIEPATLTLNERRTHASEGSSETPLGSLARTKVSLGGSETTTDSKKFIDEQWGVKGTMLKIFHCVVKGVPQITLERLVHMGPAKESCRRIIAAHCFTSILKLQNNGLIKVTKDKETNSIKHIELGPRITKER